MYNYRISKRIMWFCIKNKPYAAEPYRLSWTFEPWLQLVVQNLNFRFRKFCTFQVQIFRLIIDFVIDLSTLVDLSFNFESFYPSYIAVIMVKSVNWQEKVRASTKKTYLLTRISVKLSNFEKILGPCDSISKTNAMQHWLSWTFESWIQIVQIRTVYNVNFTFASSDQQVIAA